MFPFMVQQRYLRAARRLLPHLPLLRCL